MSEEKKPPVGAPEETAEWQRPVVQRMVAGSAEAHPNNAGDGVTGS